MNKKFNIAMLLVAMFLLSSCNQEIQEDAVLKEQSASEKKEVVKIEEIYSSYKIDLEKEFDYILNKAKVRHENLINLENERIAREINEKIKNNSRFVLKNNTDIFKDQELTEVKVKLNKRDSLYVEEVLENNLVKVKTDYYSDDIGFINSENLTDKLSDFIRIKYDGVDYDFEMPTKNYKSNKRVEVKGIYVTMNTLVNSEKLDNLIEMTKKTDINAFIIDVKNDAGTILFKSEIAKEYNERAYNKYFTNNLEEIMKKLKDNNIYTIARIVTFKSPQYAVRNPEHSITYNGTSTVYKNRNGVAWASAYDRDLWDYNIQVSMEAIEYGFNEIQFDYVRFPALSRSIRSKLDFKNEFEENRSQAIHNFLKKAYTEISKEEVYVSADIFGWAASSISDEGIGQHWEALATIVDYTCPMIYPSHYGPGIFGLEVPDANPYKTVYGSTKDAINRNENLKNAAILRPWIQDFTATWVSGYIRYGATEVKVQIDALNDLGVKEYILWNPSNRYSWEALKN